MKFLGRLTGKKSPAAASISRGDAARDRRDWAEAISAYEDALDKEPQRHGIRVQYAHVLKENGQVDEAIKIYRQALEQQPDGSETIVHLAHALKLSGDRDGARLAFEKAVHVNPSDRNSVEELRAIRRALSAKRPELAEETHGEKQARSELVSVKGQRNKLEFENRTLKQQDSGRLGRLEELQVQLSQRQAEMDARQIRSEQQKAEYEAEAAFLKEQLAAASRFEAEASSLKEQLAAASRLEAEAASLKEQLAAASRFEAEASSLRALLEDVMAARDEAERRAEQSQGEIDRLKAVLRGNHDALDAFKQELNAVQVERKTQSEALRAAEALRDAAQDEVERLTRSAASYEKTDSDTDQTLKEAMSDLEAERQAHTETKGRLTLARNEIRRAEGQITLIQDLLLRQTGL